MIKKINLEKLLMIFVIIQPILDFYLLFSDEVVSIFKFSPSTIIRMLFIGFFLIYLLFKIKYNKKYIWIFVYLLILGIYLILHILNALNFNNDIASNLRFSYITEIFYFIRMFIPILMVYITYNLDIKEKDFKNAILIVTLMFSLGIIIPNILKISLTSYDGNNIIKGNILDWFFNNSYKFEELASKGFFYMANQISSVMILLLPINIYFAIKYSDKKFVLSPVLLAISMIMIGTRVGTYGWLIIAIVVFIAWIFFSLIHKNKIGITKLKLFTYLFLTLLLFLITLNSPLVLRKTSVDYEDMEKENLTNSIKEEYKLLKEKEEKVKFINKYSEIYSIPRIYINELYLVEEDYEFWYDVFSYPYSKRGGNRNLENLITKRIYDLNDNSLDKYFGMGYSRFRNAKVYIEQDFVVQYYTLGIIAVILLLGVYIIVPTYALLYMLIKKKLRMKTTILCLSIYMTLVISYFSGHVLDELVVTIILGFICGYILKLIQKTKEVKNMLSNFKNIDYDKNNPYISVIVPVYNVEKYLRKCLDSLVNQTLKNIEIIIVNDGTKDNSQEIINEFKEKYKNIKSYIKENSGLSSARNYGLEYANGDYIAFVDSDDYIELDMYEKMYKKAISNNFDLVVCDLKYIYPKKEKLAYSNISEDIIGKDNLKKEMIKIYPAAWNKLYKKDLFNKKIRFKEKVWFEDVEFIYRLFPYINNIGVIREPLYNYLQRDGAITSVFDKRLYDYIENFNGIIKFYKKNKLYDKYKDELEYSYVRYLYATFVKRAANFSDKKEFIKARDEAIKNVKTNFPNYKRNKYLRNFKLKNLYLKYFNEFISEMIFKLNKMK